MSTSISLPQELYELFIDALEYGIDLENDDDTRLALQRCTHVSRIFWLRARRHLFYDIKIDGRLDRLSASPVDRLATFLPFATPSISGEPPLISVVRACTIRASFQPELFGQSAFVSLMELLISSDTFESLSLEAVHETWQGISPTARKLIHTICRTSHFKSLSLRGFNDMSPDVFDGSTLRDLVFYIDGTIDPKPLSVPPPLESIETSNGFPVINYPPKDGMTQFPHLKKIVSTIYEPRHLDMICNLAWEASRSLKILDLTFVFHVYLPSIRPFDLSQFPNLHCLKLRYQVQSSTAPMKDLCSYLVPPPDMRGPLPLETFQLRVTIPQDVQQSAVHTFNKDHWRVLDRALTKPHLANLRTVHITLKFIVLGMFYGANFVESKFRREANELFKPLFSRVGNTEGIDFKLEVVTQLKGRGIIPYPTI